MYKDTSKSVQKMKVLNIEKTLKLYESGTDTSIGQSTYTYLQTQLTKINQILKRENT